MIKPIGMATTLALSALLLTACGGSSDNETPAVDTPPSGTTPPPTETDGGTSLWQEGPDPSAPGEHNEFELSGIVGFNAPVAGALVCIDTDRDFTCDSDSPTAVTAEDGSYRLSVQAPYAVAEFFVLATLASSEPQARQNITAMSASSNEMTLSARAYYGGSINPLTTLEANQYDSTLNYVQQIQRYALSRALISELYQLPGHQDPSQIFNASAMHGLTQSDWAERNERVLSAYNSASEHVNSPLQALNLVNKVSDTELFAEYAEWFGYAPATSSLTSAQQQMAEGSFLTSGQRVVTHLYFNELDIINEVSDELAEARAWGDSLSLYEVPLSEDLADFDDEVELCWNASDSRWVESDYGFAGYSAPSAAGNNTYTMTRLANGQEINIQFSALSADDALFSAAVYDWDETLDFTAALVDGALVRGRYEFSEGLCLDLYNSPSIETAEFSSLSGNEIVALTHSHAYQQGVYEVDETLQRITLTQSGYQYDYRILQLGDREVLTMFSVWASPMGSYSSAWMWHDGEAERTSFMTAEELNSVFAGFTQVAISDQAAADLLIQLRALR